MDRLRLMLSRWALSPLQGTTLSLWLQALGDNRFAIHPAFWPRALLTTLSAAHNSVAARRERRLWRERIDSAQVVAPLFILGHYRSGTTHLHNLLAVDPRHAFVNNYQASFPRTFLTTEALGGRLGAALTMRKRPHDNVELNLRVPAEEELALCADTLMSPHMAWHFPSRASDYGRRYLTFREATPAERARWIESLRMLARKLTARFGPRRIVFKSPLHTARIPLLLEAFPDARFVHVHRDPYTVFQSTRNMELKVEPLFRYQRSDLSGLDERILERYRSLYDAYLTDSAGLGGDRLVEIAYSELDADPVATLERVYSALDLGSFDAVRDEVGAYLRSIESYQKNSYQPLPEALRARIAARWRVMFERWNYPF